MKPKLTIEEQISVSFMDWARYHHRRYPCLLLLHHNFNEGKRNPWKAKAMGILTGLPDYHMPVPNQTYYSFWLELKKPGEKPTAEQATVLNLLLKYGHWAGWTDNANQAIKYLEAYVSTVNGG